MNQPALQKQLSVRATDPNVLQRRASDPTSSVWVSASAGSGKTKVLTDRILRLLLPDQQGDNATAPHKILAITFTKAAASEMAARINHRLSQWAVIDSEDLTEDLKKLLGFEATTDQIETARQLFASVVDIPGGLNIMTIHSFCQSVLGRFPLEAGLPPNFKALEEQDATLLIEQALQSVLKTAAHDTSSPLYRAVYSLYTVQNNDQILSLLRDMMSERKKLGDLIKRHFDVDGLYTDLCTQFDIQAGQSVDEYIKEFFDTDLDQEILNSIADAAIGGSKSDQKLGDKIKSFMTADEKNQTARYNLYRQIFLTQKNEAVKKPLTKKLAEQFPDYLEFFAREAERCIDFDDVLNRVRVAELTRDLFLFGHEVVKQYGALKRDRNELDFDDLILKTLSLLGGKEIIPWIRFKLDEGIDHILVDEAQDTNPEQWEIIRCLCDDFFDGDAKSEQRTLFVVGDDKQSIYSFQRAAPEKFQTMRDLFDQKINAANKKFDPVNFNVSFRSAPSVLKFVDTVFDDPEVGKGLGKVWENHESFRRTQAGLVELWPLFENDDAVKEDFWDPPVTIQDSQSGSSKMANHIGDVIQDWISNEEILESYDRPIEPGDIMILVRSRTAFMDQLVRALKVRHIPVSGIDRMVLNEQLAVQDLTAVAKFALLPDDDLNLAGLLKSPFIGLNEEQLFDLLYNRESSLWKSLKSSEHTDTVEWLEQKITTVSSIPPYQFLSSLLQIACPTNAISGLCAIKSRLGNEAIDPIDEFLNTALQFEKDNVPSMQLFLQVQESNDQSLKRQMEEGSDAVRIMTVHAAKGLQAPIVMLPDTMRVAASRKPNRILWPDNSLKQHAYFCPQKDMAPKPCLDRMMQSRDKDDEEYRRLLYVAMTRAENRLYIGGYRSAAAPLPDSWYYYAQAGFDKCDDINEIETDIGTIKRLTNPATDKADRTMTDVDEVAQTEIIQPDWLFKPIAGEPTPPRPLIPSRPSIDEGEEPSVMSPLTSTHNNYRFLRGNITHKLLQTLPDVAQDKWADSAQRYVELHGGVFSDDMRQNIIDETINLLNNPAFSTIFGKGSVAEAPITGHVDNGKRVVSGQIDRLLVSDDEVLIIDYKTNRPPPREATDIPLIYQKQMQTYADVLRQIYPHKTVRGALIWTDGPILMEIPNL